ncbi:MAG: hypothetical protein H0U47_03450 [Nocardioidaceae bacterium]|nr:hypothetical protein [Nocardioidaceae bacterium]
MVVTTRSRYRWPARLRPQDALGADRSRRNAGSAAVALTHARRRRESLEHVLATGATTSPAVDEHQRTVIG